MKGEEIEKSKTEETLSSDKQKSESDKIVVIDKVQDSNPCDLKSCVIKKRNLSISTQIKTTHNKSEIGHKKKCTMHRKEKNVKNNDNIPNIVPPLTEHILMKTF